MPADQESRSRYVTPNSATSRIGSALGEATSMCSLWTNWVPIRRSAPRRIASASAAAPPAVTFRPASSSSTHFHCTMGNTSTARRDAPSGDSDENTICVNVAGEEIKLRPQNGSFLPSGWGFRPENGCPDGVDLISSQPQREPPPILATLCVNLRKIEKLGRDPNGTRTRVTGVKGRCPRPLDDGAGGSTGVGREVLVYRRRRLPVKGRHDLRQRSRGCHRGKASNRERPRTPGRGEEDPSTLIPIDDEEDADDRTGSTVSASPELLPAWLHCGESLRRLRSGERGLPWGPPPQGAPCRLESQQRRS